MPTGYTAPVADGKITELKDFAAECARGFGAFMHLRDSNTHVLTYPEAPDENSSYAKWLREAEAELARWEALDDQQRERDYAKYRAEKLAALRDSLKSKSEIRVRYMDMLAQVKAVDVPEQLQNFKNFMVEQLTQSIDFDCGNDEFTQSYHQPLSYSEWVARQGEMLPRDVQRYREHVAEEQDRYRERVEYINMMRDTFGFEVQEAK